MVHAGKRICTTTSDLYKRLMRAFERICTNKPNLYNRFMRVFKRINNTPFMRSIKRMYHHVQPT